METVWAILEVSENGDDLTIISWAFKKENLKTVTEGIKQKMESNGDLFDCSQWYQARVDVDIVNTMVSPNFSDYPNMEFIKLPTGEITWRPIEPDIQNIVLQLRLNHKPYGGLL